ncbi:MAG: hypothetical protein VKQ33_14320 [Candidatus Sericytochromatia bacterium]|nr:hypothetical protein [Candidatus Sericytochromatia bacterium]
MTEKLDQNRLNRTPDFLFRAEADALYGPPVEDRPRILAFEREMAELSEKMVLEVTALFEEHELELDLSEESLEDLDRLVDQLWPEPIEDEEALDAIVANWGAYLGQTVLEHLGGQWTFRQDLEHASLHFARLGLEAFPLHVVRKRLLLGAGHSLAGCYEALVERLTTEG